MLLTAPTFTQSPKKQFLQELTILFASYQIDKVKTFFADDITWTLVGDQPVHGKEAFAATLNRMAGNKASELTIHSILTDGRDASIHGEMVMEDGKRYGFADFYMFTSAGARKIQSITSYVIALSTK